MRKARYLSLVGAALMIAGPLAMAAEAAASVNANGDNNGVADLNATWICGNGVQGASIKLGGTAKVRGVGVAVRFEATGNRANADTQANVDGIDITLDSGSVIPKSPRAGGAGGNPYIYFIAKDKNNQEFGSHILLGRCNGPSSGAARVQAQVMAGVASFAELGSAGCKNNGSSISSARRHNAGLKGSIKLSNRMDLNGAPAGHVAEDDMTATTDIGLGTFFAEKRGNIETGVGGNPTIKILMWKTRGNSDVTKIKYDATSPTSVSYDEVDGAAVSADDILTFDANGNKGFKTLGRCSELR